ncbi:hypothetical protein [Actinosynnema sp. NPDC023587]|uniref:hypothetical protein n=1 Tax=Actinosynnema sp. NPDC023587 TaxID=3154695 RepID=UPI0033EF708F
MSGGVVPRLSAEDAQAVGVLRGLGYRVADIQSIATRQDAFAVRVGARRDEPADGLRFTSRTVELGDGAFTNSFELHVDLDRCAVEAASSATGFHLRDVVDPPTVLAAVSGSFSFISDDPGYQPLEPCLDFCCRAGAVVSLPTATKPAFVVHGGVPAVRPLRATGVLSVGGRRFDWIGSKLVPGGLPRRPGELVVFGAANCRVLYAASERTGFLRFVDRAGNTTPATPAAVDFVVSPTSEGHAVTGVHRGGRADLFAGAYVLRGHAALADAVRVGDPVRVSAVDDLDVAGLSSGVSVGPSVADAAAGSVDAYDDCLGVSPFRDVRYGRTLIGLSGRRLVLRVFDGAPLASAFQGVTPVEVAAVLHAEGVEPGAVHHLDGGQSSKIALARPGAVEVVGSLHYLEWPPSPETPFRWRGLEGRLLRSCFAVTRKAGGA